MKVQSSSSASDRNLLTSDITTNNVSTTKHGFQPKASAAGTTVMLDSGAYGAVTESYISLSDVTTGNASTAAHGFAPKLWASAWQTYTPSWTNVTTTSSTVVGRFIQIGKTVHYETSVTFGGTDKPTGSVSVSVPATAVSYPSFATVGHGSANDSGATVYPLFHALSSTTVGAVFFFNGTSYVFASATVPFTWGVGDILQVSGTYEAA